MKKAMRLYAAACAALLALWLCVPAAFAAQANLPQNGMVIIIGEGSDGNAIYGIGLAVGGTEKGADTFVTVCDLARSKTPTVGIAVDVLDKTHLVEGEITYSDETLGIAVVTAKTPIANRTPVTLAGANGIRKGDAVGLLGYSANGSSIGPNDVLVSKGTVIDPAYAMDGKTYLQTDCRTDFICLGGPIANQNGEVAGIYLGTAGQAGTILALPAESLKGAGTKPTGVDYRILIGAGVVGIAAFFVARGLKKRKAARPVPAEARSTAAEAAQPSAGPTVAANVAQQMAGQTVQVCGVSGYFNGNSITVQDRVLIGRDPKRCNLVFPARTEGVSALHCELRNVSGHLELTDRGSTYGTFLGDGRRLEVNRSYPLQRGDNFYLGVKNNKFRVGA